jgi:uncharacterized membrane protein YcaP (DUF421 family)
MLHQQSGGIAMFSLTTGVGELIVRAAIVYVFLFVLFRFGGKKHLGEMAPFDFVILLILSESVNGALIGDEKSVAGGLISAATLIAIVHSVNYLCWYSKRAERLFEGAPKVLVRHGHVNREVMAEEKVTQSELIEALRREGHASLEKVRFAVLENDGTITVGLRLQR